MLLDEPSSLSTHAGLHAMPLPGEEKRRYYLTEKSSNLESVEYGGRNEMDSSWRNIKSTHYSRVSPSVFDGLISHLSVEEKHFCIYYGRNCEKPQNH